MQIYRLAEHGLEPLLPEQAFPFLKEKNHIVSLVGAGGKTTLLYTFAGICAEKGWRTAVTTTTHIYHPSAQKDGRFGYAPEEAALLENLCKGCEEDVKRSRFCYVPEFSGLQECWENGDCAVCGTIASEEKLGALSEVEFQRLEEAADCVLIEADGAKHLPCKAPADHEPVLRPESDIVVGVMGLSAVGRPLKEVCFRSSEAAELLGVSETHILEETDLAKLLLSEQGTRKQVGDRQYYVVLNQCDDALRRRSGETILRILHEQGMEHTAFLSMRKQHDRNDEAGTL